MTVAGGLDCDSRIDLHELYARYTHAFDEGQAEEVADLFTADGEFLRPGADAVRGRSDLIGMVSAAAARGAGTRHLVSAVVVRAGTDADTAAGTAYVQVVTIGDEALRLIAIGRYTDEFVRDAGRWLFRSRRFTPVTGPVRQDPRATVDVMSTR